MVECCRDYIRNVVNGPEASKSVTLILGFTFHGGVFSTCAMIDHAAATKQIKRARASDRRQPWRKGQNRKGR